MIKSSSQTDIFYQPNTIPSTISRMMREVNANGNRGIKESVDGLLDIRSTVLRLDLALFGRDSVWRVRGMLVSFLLIACPIWC